MSDIYITRNELRVSPYSIDRSICDDTFLEVLQDLTKDLIDKFCMQEFSAEGTSETYVEKKVDGTGKDTVFLPKKIVTLNKVRIYTGTNSYTDYTSDNFEVKTKYISWKIFSEIYTSSRYRIESFCKGTSNIGIFGIWGWSTVPNPIKYLQGKMILKIIKDKAFAEKFSSSNVGDFSYTLNKIEGYSPTGDYELDTIIRQYRDWFRYGTY